MNPKSILLLYEGETEGEFYKKIIDIKVPKRKIRISYDNLKGITTNINNKVLHKINKHLSSNLEENNIHVFIGIDREGDRTNESPLDIPELIRIIRTKTTRVVEIVEILATQDIECWYFLDLDGIYDYLKVPKNKRSPRNYRNSESQNNRILSSLFRQHNKVYLKGKKVEGFIRHLDLNKIYDECEDLKDGIEKMIKLTNPKSRKKS